MRPNTEAKEGNEHGRHRRIGGENRGEVQRWNWLPEWQLRLEDIIPGIVLGGHVNTMAVGTWILERMGNDRFPYRLQTIVGRKRG